MTYRRRRLIFGAVAATAATLLFPIAASHAQNAPAPAKPAPKKAAAKKMASPIVTMQTTKGTIKIKLFPEVTPNTVNNFIKLVSKGYYNGKIFHRVERGPAPDLFIIQGGSSDGVGRAGAGYEIKNEDNKQLKHQVGAIAMANAGPDTADAQFYIVTTQPAFYLDAKDERGISKYTIFGQVISGQDVAEKIEVGDKMTKVSVELPKGFVPAAPVATDGTKH